jgi:hypothetical protein
MRRVPFRLRANDGVTDLSHVDASADELGTGRLDVDGDELQTPN